LGYETDHSPSARARLSGDITLILLL